MPYTVKLFEWTSTEVFTEKTDGSVRLKNANNATVDTANGIVKPTTAGGSDFSYEKWLRLKITADTTSGSTSAAISALEFYTDGTNSFGTGGAMFVRATSTFTTPVEPTSTTAFSDAFSFNSTSTLSLSTASHNSTGWIGKFLVATFRGTTGIAVGLTPTETGTFKYSEST